MRTIRVVLAIAVLCCATAYADSMDATGTGLGNAVLYFSGTSATGAFTSTFKLTGRLSLDGIPIAFSASGWARGSGNGDTATLDIDAQATFAVSGSTETGESISVQGGLTLSGLTADTTDSSGSGTGVFIATVFIGDKMYRVQGDAEGAATGTFVVPEDPYSMELAGDAIFSLSGDMTRVTPADDSTLPTEDTAQANACIIELLPWEPVTWPAELLAELLEILTNVVEITAAEPSENE